MEINGQTVSGAGRYDEMGLSPALMRAIEKKGYVEATPIQTGAIPHFLDWKDVIAKAPTWTGSSGTCALLKRGSGWSASTAASPSTPRLTS